jgi:hypothetical protein
MRQRSIRPRLSHTSFPVDDLNFFESTVPTIDPNRISV